MPVGFEQDGTTGVIKYNGTDILAVAEKIAQKEQPNGYVGTDGANFLNRSRIPAFTGLLAQDFDPVSTLYVKNLITTIKTYSVGDGASIQLVGYQLPPHDGTGLLRPRLLIKFSDNSSIVIDNNTNQTKQDNFQGIANFLMGDATTGQNAQNNGKRIVAVAFEVQNTDVNNDIQADIGTFRVRAYVVPAGGGSITITP